MSLGSLSITSSCSNCWHMKSKVLSSPFFLPTSFSAICAIRNMPGRRIQWLIKEGHHKAGRKDSTPVSTYSWEEDETLLPVDLPVQLLGSSSPKGSRLWKHIWLHGGISLRRLDLWSNLPDTPIPGLYYRWIGRQWIPPIHHWAPGNRRIPRYFDIPWVSFQGMQQRLGIGLEFFVCLQEDTLACSG